MSVPFFVLGQHSGAFLLCETTSREVRGGFELAVVRGVEG